MRRLCFNILSFFEVLAWLILFISFLVITISFNLNANDILVIISILIMVLIFRLQIFFENYRHNKNQISLLKSIINNLDILSKERNICCLKIIGHINWYKEEANKNNIPLHPIKEIDDNFYIGSLDYEIEDKSTYELKQALQLINDKIYLINSYAKRLIDSEYSDLKKETKNKIKKEFLEKLKSTIPDLEMLSCCVRQLLKNNWNLK